jgi:hypothetical protein
MTSVNQPIVQAGTPEDLVFLGVDSWQVEEYKRGPYFVGVHNERVIGAAGIVVFWRGVGEAWVVTTDELLRDHPMWFAKTTKRYMHHMISVLNLRRLQATVDASVDSNLSFIEFLGMQAEGAMLHYGPEGEDCIRYAWVRS